MARADTWTLLCIDDWARYMAIHPDAWNQSINCIAPYPGACERVWIQNGWLDMCRRARMAHAGTRPADFLPADTTGLGLHHRRRAARPYPHRRPCGDCL